MPLKKKFKESISSDLNNVGWDDSINFEQIGDTKIQGGGGSIQKNVSAKGKESSNKIQDCSSTGSPKETVIESILGELRNLKNGWSGPESIAPSTEICEDVNKFLRILKPKSSKNFDLWGDDDGTITFFWQISDDILFSVDIYGDGIARCTYTPGKTGKSEFGDFDFSDKHLISDFVNSKVKHI